MVYAGHHHIAARKGGLRHGGCVPALAAKDCFLPRPMHAKEQRYRALGQFIESAVAQRACGGEGPRRSDIQRLLLKYCRVKPVQLASSLLSFVLIEDRPEGNACQ